MLLTLQHTEGIPLRSWKVLQVQVQRLMSWQHHEITILLLVPGLYPSVYKPVF